MVKAVRNLVEKIIVNCYFADVSAKWFHDATYRNFVISILGVEKVSKELPSGLMFRANSISTIHSYHFLVPVGAVLYQFDPLCRE